MAKRILAAALWALIAPACSLAQGVTPACNEFTTGGVEEAMRRPGHDAECYRFGMWLIRQAGPYNRRLEQAGMVFTTLRRYWPQSAFAYIGGAEYGIRRRELGLGSEDSIATIHDQAMHATRIAPHMADAYVTLGRADLLEGCLACAQRSADRAEELGADSPDLALLRARIAERSGKPDVARALLERAAVAPGLPAETLYSLRLALGEFELRQRDHEAADRAYALAAEAQPEDPDVVLRRANLRLYQRGDLDGAVAIATQNPRLARIPEVKRLLAVARYVAWSRDRIQGRPAEDLRQLAQTSYVGPESAWIACARYPALMKEFAAMLDAGITKSVDARDDAGDTALIAAAAGGNESGARLLLARGASANAEDRYRHRPLQFAVARSDRALTRMLLEAGAQVDYEDLEHRSALLLAVQNGDAELAAMLLRHRGGAPVLPPRAATMLAAAARADDAATLQVLLEAKIPADLVAGGGPTPLVVAVQSRSRNAARVLLQYGADPAPALDAAHAVGDEVLIELLKHSQKRSI